MRTLMILVPLDRVAHPPDRQLPRSHPYHAHSVLLNPTWRRGYDVGLPRYLMSISRGR